MNRIITKLFGLVAVLALVGMVSGCTEETQPGGGSNPPATKLQFNSASSTSINVRWQRGAGDVGPDTVEAFAKGTTSPVVATAVANSAQSSVQLGGLQTGKEYDIYVRGNGGRS